MSFADKIIQLRKKQGWSQEDLAERMNVTRQSVSKWESAQSMPDLEKILALSELFQVSVDYLLKEDVQSPKLMKSVLQADSVKEEHSKIEVEIKPNKVTTWCDVVCFVVFGILAFSLLKYEEVKFETTLTYIVTPLVWYDFIIIPLFLKCAGYLWCRAFLVKGQLHLSDTVKTIGIVLMILFESIYFTGGLWLIYGAPLMDSDLVSRLYYVLKWFAEQGSFVFIGLGFISALLATSVKSVGNSGYSISKEKLISIFFRGKIYWIFVLSIQLMYCFITGQWKYSGVFWLAALVLKRFYNSIQK